MFGRFVFEPLADRPTSHPAGRARLNLAAAPPNGNAPTSLLMTPVPASRRCGPTGCLVSRQPNGSHHWHIKVSPGVLRGLLTTSARHSDLNLPGSKPIAPGKSPLLHVKKQALRPPTAAAEAQTPPHADGRGRYFSIASRKGPANRIRSLRRRPGSATGCRRLVPWASSLARVASEREQHGRPPAAPATRPPDVPSVRFATPQVSGYNSAMSNSPGDGSDARETPTAAELAVWEYAGLLLTYWCNARCACCYVYGGPDRGGSMSVDTAVSLWRSLDRLASQHGKRMRIHLSGGEPFRDWPRLVASFVPRVTPACRRWRRSRQTPSGPTMTT